FLLGVATALADGLADRALAGVAGALLAEDLAGGAFDFAAGERAHGALALVGVVHDQGLLEQFLAHLAAELGFIDLEGVDLAAGLVEDWDLNHCFVLSLVTCHL